MRLPTHVLVPLVLVAGCGGASDSSRILSCVTQGDCPGGTVCAQGECRDEAGDPDWDGVPTGAEVAAGTNPLDFDTDGDGLGDGQEWGEGGAARDTDGDGLPDALESARDDRDGDCIPDHLDPHDRDADPADITFALPHLCRPLGRCLTLWDTLTLACVDGVAVCAWPDGTPIPKTEGACDGEDDDCDGEEDEGQEWEGLPLGAVCAAPGVCGAGLVECDAVTAAPRCSSAPGGSTSPAVAEFCNGKDDDCDGVIDDGYLYQGHHMGEPCVAPGLCGMGVVECTSSGLAADCSTGPGGSTDLSSDEQCDGLDNDCDGDTDEGLTGPGALACPDTGVCAGWRDRLQAVCAAGVWICAGAREGLPFEPGEEVTCDGLDNDCDGQADEAFVIEDFDGATRAVGEECGAGQCLGGKVVCAGEGAEAACSTWNVVAPEQCDGLDNDCDGQADEGLAYDGKGLGEPCNGVGSCGNGVVECHPATATAVCSTDPGGSLSEAQAESCDLLDNDCDGEVDEAPEPPPGVCPGDGVCQGALASIASCTEGAWVCQFEGIPGYQASESLCDGLDNDCDGKVDEFQDKTFSPAWIPDLPPGPGPRRGGAWDLGPDGVMLLVGGAQTAVLPATGSPPCRDDAWVLDPVTGGWSPLGPLGVPARGMGTLSALPDGGWLLVGGRCGPGAVAPSLLIPPDLGEAQAVLLPPTAANRWDHAALVEPGGALWLIGGRTEDGLPAPDLRLTAELSDSGPLEGFASPARARAMRSADGLAALVLGATEPGAPFTQAWEVRLDTGLVAAAMETGPLPRDGFALARTSGGVLLQGGWSPDGELTGELWRYDLDSGTWSLLAPEGPPLADALLYEAGGGLRLTGGFDALGIPGVEEWVAGDVEAPTWQPAGAPRPPPRVAAGAGLDTVHGQLCLTGGVATGSSGFVWLQDTWCRPGLQGPWIRASAEGGPPSAFSTFTHDPIQDRFLLVGGAAAAGDGAPVPLAPLCAFFAFHRSTATWESLGGCEGQEPPPAPLTRSGHAAAVRISDATLWVFGGLTPQGIDAGLWRLDLSGETWAAVPLLPAPTPRYGHHLFVRTSGDLLVAGGSGSLGAVEVLRPAQGEVIPVATLPWSAVPWLAASYDPQSDRLFLADGKQAAVVSLQGLGPAQVTSMALPPADCVTGAAPITVFDTKARAGLLLGGLDAAGRASARECLIPTICTGN